MNNAIQQLNRIEVPFFAMWSSWRVAGNYLNLDGLDGHRAEGGTFCFPTEALMTQPDTRQPWELEYCLRFNFCNRYLDMMASTGMHRAMLSTAYGVNGDLDKWCIQRINGLLDKCAALVKRHGSLSIAARGAVQSCAQRLRGMEWCGNARLKDVGFTRTE